MLPDMNGLALCQRIREHHHFPIIMLTAKNEETDKITGLTLGADDYITKPFRPLEVIARVKAQLRRYKKYNPTHSDDSTGEVLSHSGLVMNIKTHECLLNEQPLVLTPTEFSILQFLLEHKGNVVSSEELFHHIWKNEYYSKKNNTITVHIRHLREKMKDSFDEPRYIKRFGGVDIKLKNKFFEQERDLQVLYRKLFFQMVIVAILYTVIGIAAYIGIRQILEHIEIFYSLVNWIEVNRVIGFFTYIIVGYIIILIYFWKKPFSYLNDVLIATSSMYGQENKMITLPSQLKTIENYLNELRSDIQESKTAALNAEQRKNDMISFLAHDLKTPLTSIIGYLSLLNDTPDMSKEEKAKCVHVSIEKAQRLEEMINEFFDITRYNLHQVELEKEIIDLYYMFVQLSDEFYPLLSEHGNTIQLLADEDLTVYADPVKLARVFNNILKNAIYYSYPDTEIIVSGKKVQANIVITFQNQGKTIPQQKLVALFDKFFRLDDARTSNTGGTGLGLAIAKDIVNLHGGNITAESQDEITIFTITLPS